MALDDAAIQAIVDGIDPLDWVQIRLTANLTPAQRTMAGLQAAEFAKMIVRGVFARRYPELTQSELNMKVLAHFTPLRMSTEALKLWRESLARARPETGQELQK